MASSSGGTFIALAKEIISQSGVVFGAVFDENWEVKHTYAETLEGIKHMMGSKYLQSRIENNYQETEKFLKEGRKVLFTGTPCQIAGLHKFLRKEYPNLLSVDILCHGVPSPGVWRKYLAEISHKVIRSENCKNLKTSCTYQPIINDIEFRNKELKGWNQYSFVIKGKSSITDDNNTILYSETHNMNTYMKGFLADIYLRPCCYNCKCKNGVSHSDLTIADFWGVGRLMVDFDDDKGTGLVLINTKKGKKFFDYLNMESRSSNLADVKIMNKGFNEHILEHPKRNVFFECLGRGDNMKDTVEKILYIPIYKIFWTKIKNKIKRIVSINR